MRIKLTKSVVDALACPPGRRDALYFDAELRGFGVRVTRAGRKIFLLQSKNAGRVERFVLGEHGEITAAEARRLAEQGRGQVRAGLSPQTERRARIAAVTQAAEAQAFTFDQLVVRWVDTALKDGSASHRREAPRAIRVIFRHLMELPAHQVEAAAAQRAIDAVAANSETMARRGRDYARSAYNWALRRRLVPTNPFGAVVVDGRLVSRDRVLSDAELGEAWRATRSLSYPYGPFLQLVILTLQRRGEVAGMRWDEIAPDLSSWTIPAHRAKNRKAHIVYLTAPARAILSGIARVESSPFVFTTFRRRRASSAGVPPQDFSGAAERMRAAILAERTRTVDTAPSRAVSTPLDWRVHDFRRTGVTALARLGIPPHVADRLLNHVQGTIRGVAAVYQRHEFLAEREKALDAWADHVLAVGVPSSAHSGGQHMAGPEIPRLLISSAETKETAVAR